jgi:hypothetical protein
VFNALLCLPEGVPSSNAEHKRNLSRCVADSPCIRSIPMRWASVLRCAALCCIPALSLSSPVVKLEAASSSSDAGAAVRAPANQTSCWHHPSHLIILSAACGGDLLQCCSVAVVQTRQLKGERQCLGESWSDNVGVIRGETLGDAGENLSQDSQHQLHLGGELRRVHTPGATTGPIAIHAGFLNTSETLASTTTDNTHPPDRPHCPLLDAQPTTLQYRNTASARRTGTSAARSRWTPDCHAHRPASNSAHERQTQSHHTL